MENKKSNTGLIVIVVVLVMLLLFGGCLFLLSSMGYLSFDNDGVKEQETVDDSQENEGSILDDFKISYVEEEYKEENNNGLVNLKNTRNLPVIESVKYRSSADKIVIYLKSVSDKQWEGLKYDMDVYKDYPNAMNIGVDLLFSTNKLTDNYVSFNHIMSGSMGGVGWGGDYGYVFEIESGNVIEFSSVCVDENVKDSFYDYIVNKIENNVYYDNLYDEWKDTVKEDMFNLGYWYFTDAGIRFTFDKYTLGPGATGVIKVDMPYSDANQYLKDEYKG